MAQASSYRDLATILQGTAYADCIANDPNQSQRALTALFFRSAQVVAGWLPSKSFEVVSWYLRRFEVENIKTIIRQLHHARSKVDAEAVLLPITSPGLPWPLLMESGSMAVLIDRLSHTVYGRPLANAWQRYEQ